MPLPSFGAWERVRECPASGALTQHRTESEAATKGKVLHAFFCDAIQFGRDEALERAPEEYRDACAAIDLDALPVKDPAGWAPEVQIVYDVVDETAREVGRGNNTQLNFGERRATETRGILDVAGLTSDGEGVAVVDYKTGFRRQSARESWQMRMGSLAAARLWKRDYAIAVILRPKENGEVFRSTARFDAFDLDGFAEDARNVLERVTAVHSLVGANRLREVKTYAGSWCKFCPALPGCPQHAQLALQLANGPDLLELELQRQLTPELAAIAWERLDVIDNLVGRLRGSLYALGGQTPFTLRNGMVVGPVWKSRDKIAGEGAHQHVLAKWGAEHADLALKKQVTKKGLHAAARSFAKAKGLKIKHEYDGALAELAGAGLLVETRKLSIEPHEGSAEDAEALEAYLLGTADGTLQKQLEASVAAGAGGSDGDDPF